MRLRFLGVGGAFTLSNWQSNVLLENQEQTPGGPRTRRLLIDCGSDIRFSLAEQGLSASDIDAVYISHCHADHAGGLEWFTFNRFIAPDPKPELFVNERVAQRLWDHCLSGGMASRQGLTFSLEKLFSRIHRLPDGGSFRWCNTNFETVMTRHYFEGEDLLASFGLRIEPRAGGVVYLSTDTLLCLDLHARHLQESGLIFYDCETYDWLNGRKTSGVHATYGELKTLPPEIRRKMWLYHYQDGELPDAVQDGFAGFAKKGQSFEL